MPQISLATYTLRVRAKYQRQGEEEWETLGSINLLQPSDFLDFLDAFFAALHHQHEEDQGRQTLLVVDEYVIDDRTVHGLVRAGPWGVAADIVDHRTRDLRHEMSPDEAPLIPYFFLLHVPSDTERGIMILQRHGGSGVKTHFCTALQRAFTEWKDGYLLDFWRHVPGRVLEFLTSGEMRQVELISYDIPRDLADLERDLRDTTPEWDQIRGEIRTRIVAKRNTRFPIPPRFRDVVTGRRTFHEVREELDLPENGRVQITIDYGGAERTIDLADPEAISPLIDITDEVRTENGVPVQDDLLEYARGLLAELIPEVRGRYQ